MRVVLFLAVLVAACVPMMLGSKRVRPCYKGCHGCGKCMKSFRDGGEESARSSGDS